MNEKAAAVLRRRPSFAPPRLREPTPLLAALERLQPHDHLCVIYTAREEALAAVVPWLRLGLERGERCLCLGDEASAGEVLRGLKADGIDAAAAVESGALSVVGKRDDCLSGGRFDPDRAIRLLEEKAKEAESLGYASLRATGEMSWTLGGEPDGERLVEYEAKLNEAVLRGNFSALGQYDRSRLAPALIKEAIHTHPYVISGGVVAKNPFFIPLQEYLPPAQSGVEVERLLDNIVEFQRTQNELRRQADEVRDLYEHAPCGYHSLDADGIYVRVNETELRWLGYAREEILGRKRFVDLLTSRSRKIFGANFPAYKESGEIRDLEFDMVRRDGSILPVILNSTAVKDASGRFVMSRSIVYDNTLRKKEHEARARLASIVESSDDAILSKNLDGIITSWNAGASKLYGYAPEDIVGKSFMLLVPPESAEEGSSLLKRIRRGERVPPYETTRVCRDGRRLRVALTVSPILDGSGAIIGASTIAHDHTQRILAEEALRRSEANLNRAQAVAHVGSWFLDLSRNELLWSDEAYRIFEIRSGTPMTYAAFLERVHPDDRPAVEAAWAGALRHEPYDIEHRALVGGGIKWVRERAEVEFGPDGRALRGIGTVQDVTELKRAEDEVRALNAGLEERVRVRTAELEAANKDLEAFAFSVSHDLRAPLRTMDGFSRLLLDRYAPSLEPECRRYLGLVRKGAETMGALIDDLLEFSRLGRQAMAKSRVSMEEVVRAAIVSLEEQSKDRRVVIKTGPLPPCEGDRALLLQVWINLLSNALKFTRARPEALIEIDARDEGGETVYRVKDNGVGFDMSGADKLFNVFHRLHPKTEYEGTGVGLAIVSRIIERHGGRVWARGEPGRGAEFQFTLGGGAGA